MFSNIYINYKGNCIKMNKKSQVKKALISLRGGFAQSASRIRKLITSDGSININEIPGVKKSFEKINNLNGEINDQSIQHFSDYLKTLGRSLIKHKLKDGIFAGLIDNTLHSILNNGIDKLTWVVENENINLPPNYITRTNVHVGSSPNKKLKKALNGPFHMNNFVTLENTETDWIDHNRRIDLVSNCGFNERGFDVLMDPSFLSLDELESLIDWKNKYEKIIREERIIMKEEELKNNENNRIEIAKRRNKKRSSKYYAGITKIVTNIKIRNRLPVYPSTVIIHLCQPISPLINSEADIGSIFNGILKNINKEKIYSNKIDEFKGHITTSLDTQIKKFDEYRKHFTIVKSWKRKLGSGAQWHFKLTEHIQNGFLLNLLLEKKNRGDTPISYFYIIEYFGDPRATITRSKDQDIFEGYSPVELSYRLSNKIHFIANIDESDKPIVMKVVERDGEFEDKTLFEEFHPTRKNTFHVNFKDIKINELNGNGDYSLNFAGDLSESGMISKVMDKLIDLGLDKNKFKNLTEDDLEVENLEDLIDNINNFINNNDEEDLDNGSQEDDEEGQLRNVKP